MLEVRIFFGEEHVQSTTYVPEEKEYLANCMKYKFHLKRVFAIPWISQLFWHGIWSALEYGQEIARIMIMKYPLRKNKTNLYEESEKMFALVWQLYMQWYFTIYWCTKKRFPCSIMLSFGPLQHPGTSRKYCLSTLLPLPSCNWLRFNSAKFVCRTLIIIQSCAISNLQSNIVRNCQPCNLPMKL